MSFAGRFNGKCPSADSGKLSPPPLRLSKDEPSSRRVDCTLRLRALSEAGRAWFEKDPDKSRAKTQRPVDDGPRLISWASKAGYSQIQYYLN